MMHYIIITVVFFVLMLFYFKVAERYNIIDKPNHRSAHTEITLRGGGIIYPLAFLFFLGYEFFFNSYMLDLNESDVPPYWAFGLGMLLLCSISFIDDLTDVSTRVRLIFHFVSVSLLLYFINAFQLLPIWALPISFIIIIGILNAYNFMDGINGMAGLYSLVVLGSLMYVNLEVTAFVNPDFIIYPLIASIVFIYFNFRTKAKCFLGDIGSMGVAFWIIALLGLLIIKTEQLKWLLFLVVYGVETVLTIMERLKLKENIFIAHRHHLYQLFVNEKKVSHLYVSSAYALSQLLINVIVITLDFSDQMSFIVIVLPAALFYVILKGIVKKQTSIK